LGVGAEAIKEGGACAGCACTNDCDDGKCACCGLQHTITHSFYTPEGLLKQNLVNDLIYECNSFCECASFDRCINRVVQKGSEIPVQVFKTPQKGWGVKTLVPIKANQFVEEYLGEIIVETEAEERGQLYDRIGCSYLFDLGVGHENKFTIDAQHYGNSARFYNHSCEPNLESHKVCIEVQDDHAARIAFFAARDIAAGEELEFDYRYQILKRIRCYCGKPNCKKWVQ
jgi:histone-lysine N-methyltransferase SUV39H